MHAYKVFKKWEEAILDKHEKVMNPPKGYHKIKVHLVFAARLNGTPSGPKNLQHFAPHNFSSRVNPKTRK